MDPDELILTDIEARILGRLVNGEEWLRKDIHGAMESSLDPRRFQAALDSLQGKKLLETVQNGGSADTTSRHYPSFKITSRGLIALLFYESATTLPPRQA